MLGAPVEGGLLLKPLLLLLLLLLLMRLLGLDWLQILILILILILGRECLQHRHHIPAHQEL